MSVDMSSGASMLPETQSAADEIKDLSRQTRRSFAVPVKRWLRRVSENLWGPSRGAGETPAVPVRAGAKQGGVMKDELRSRVNRASRRREVGWHPRVSAARSRVHSFILHPAALLVLLTFVAPVARAHESRPAYLEINQTYSSPTASRYDVLWRTPINAGMRLPIALQFPASVRNLTEPVVRELSDSLVERRIIEINGGLAGQRIDLPGLQATITDVLVRMQNSDGSHWTMLVHPSQPWVEIAPSRGRLAVLGTYVVQGIRHISFGADHLLFVLGLLLIVRDRGMLLKTVTAFTLAHSITLGLATFGYADAPVLPLNAAIALSILFLGPEIVRSWRGETSFTIRHPWVVAFAFGLLHGFGFAGALTSAGLPRNELPLALLGFNVGVELGQVAFVLNAISFLLLGGLVASDLKLSLAITTALAVGLGFFHGFLNGAAMGQPAAGSIALLGLVSAVFVLVAFAASLVVRLRWPWTRIAVRVAGSWIAACGLLMFGWAMRRG